MLYLRSTVGYFIAGLFAMGVWATLWNTYGLLGGFAAALIIIGPMWYMNHYVGLIQNDNDDAYVDMALGIAVAVTMRDVFMNGFDTVVASLPTLSFVILGGVLGCTVAAFIEKDMAKKDAETDKLFDTSTVAASIEKHESTKKAN